MTKSQILSTHDLSIGYQNGKKTFPVLTNINLCVPTNELICILGPNGIGKSTLLKTLGKLQKELSGEIKLLGKNVHEYSTQELSTKISFVLTEPVSADNMTLKDFISIGRYPYTNWLGSNNSYDKKIIEKVILDTSIQEYQYKNIIELSDGVKQRAMIARALAQETPIMFLDEPTAFIDLPTKIEIMSLLKELSHKDKTILLTTHDLDLAVEFADRLWLLEPDGRVITGMPEDLILNGQFEKTFNKKNVYFEKFSGKFRTRRTLGKKVSLNGGGLEFLWTKKALERNGYCVEDGDNDIEIKIIKSDDQLEWTVNSKHSISNLEELMLKLNEMN